MEEIKLCKYNIDNDTIGIVKSDGSKMTMTQGSGLTHTKM